MRFFILALLIFFDFISKQIILNFIKLNELVSLVFFLDITHIHNYGIAFGLFSDVLPIWFIVLSGILLTIFLLFWMFKTSNVLEKWGILLIIAGAISNISDRLLNNYVLDFIFLHYKHYYWPAFNFADIYISAGVIIIIIESYNMYKTRLKDNNE